MNFNEKEYVLNASASFRELGDEGIILMATSGQLYSTNLTGTAFMNELGKNMNLEKICSKISEDFEVEIDVLTKDIQELVEHLLDEGVLEIKNSE